MPRTTSRMIGKADISKRRTVGLSTPLGRELASRFTRVWASVMALSRSLP